MRKPKYFYDEMWKMNFYYFIGWTDKSFKKYCADNLNYHKDISGVAARCLFVEGEKGFNGNYIWVKDKKDLGAFVHECVHAACNTLLLRGWKPDLDNEEPLAYLVEIIFRKGLEKVKTKRGKASWK